MDGLRIYIDMDGVLADFDSAAKKLKENFPDELGNNIKPDEVLDFSTFTPMPGAIDAVAALIDMGHDVYIATTPPWNNKDAWGQKGRWVEEHLPLLKRKMFLTHRKDLLKGDILIDDTTYRGQRDFEGEFMHFGKDGMDWPYVVETIRNMTNILTIINK
jgi:5'(3')-deoxyribonucleotidase